jgi:hypothetical protein
MIRGLVGAGDCGKRGARDGPALAGGADGTERWQRTAAFWSVSGHGRHRRAAANGLLSCLLLHSDPALAASPRVSRIFPAARRLRLRRAPLGAGVAQLAPRQHLRRSGLQPEHECFARGVLSALSRHTRQQRERGGLSDVECACAGAIRTTGARGSSTRWRARSSSSWSAQRSVITHVVPRPACPASLALVMRQCVLDGDRAGESVCGYAGEHLQ